VVERFVHDYREGRTPNPCVECNRTVKFDKLLEQARTFGCDLLVTGHYARVKKTGSRFTLHRGRDRRKDQSYVLAMLGQEALNRVRFPVGELTKDETRSLASSLNLRTADKADSQDICFVGRGGYRHFLQRHDPSMFSPGAIVEGDRAVGRHDGVASFTIGQRQGLGVALGERRYVVAVHPDSQTVVLGTRDQLAVKELQLEQITWTNLRLSPMSTIEVQYRSHGRPASAVWKDDRVRFTEPQWAIAPGQTAALYRGDEVLGSGVITATS
jgi:tRNA-specific 2-thiouridylase